MEGNLWDERLTLILDIGEQMMVSGAEVSRVEDSIYRICMAYGADKAEVLSITTSLIVTVYPKEQGSVTQTRRIKGFSSDMNRLDKMNALSRHICERKMDVGEARKEYDSVIAEGRYQWQIRLFAYLLVAFAFSMFFGGDVSDGLVSAIIAIPFFGIDIVWNRFKLNNFLMLFVSSLVGGFLASAFVAMGLAHSVSMVSIGDVMILIPGIILTNSMRDMFGGDTITGVVRFLEAILTAVTIAFGFTASEHFFNNNFVVLGADKAFTLPLYILYPVEIVMAFLGALGYSTIYNVKGDRLAACGLGGGLSWIAYLFAGTFTVNDPSRYLFATIVVTFYAEKMAKYKKAPATIFLVSAIMPLVPGGSLYRSLSYAVDQKWHEFSMTGMNTLVIALAIAVGMLVTTSVYASARERKKLRLVGH